MRILRAQTGGGSYRILVGGGALGRLPAELARLFPARRAALASDSFLLRGPAGRLTRLLRRAGWRVDEFAFPRGEAAKSPEAVSRFQGFLLRRGAERRSPVLAVGGGTIGDAAGFAAATYMRGVPLVQVPTTLLAQVDSAVGGKTAVNHPLAKNAVGAFHQPALVACDTDLLEDLPKRELLSGLGEVAKYALVFDGGFLRRLSEDWEELLARSGPVLERTVARCAALKAGIAAEDERDLSGRRELLNFGHTLGHALEAAGGYGALRHGEAVAWGMRLALLLSRRRGWLKATGGRAEALLSRLPAPAWPRGATAARLLAAMSRDKKAAGGRLVFVLLKEAGRPARVRDVSRAEVLEALEAVRRPA